MKLRKRILKCLFVILIIVSMLPLSTIEVFAVGNYGVNLNGIAYKSGTNPFANGECTWYSWGRAYEKLGVNVPCRGDAHTWDENAKGFEVGTIPRENSIAVWEKSSSSPIGHVAFVEKYENGLVYISESNNYYKDKNGNIIVPKHVYSEGYINQNGNYYNTFTNYSTKLPSWAGRGLPNKYIYLAKSSPMVTPSISFDKSSYKVGDKVTVTWALSPSSSFSHYWIILKRPDGSTSINENIDKSVSSYSFTVDAVGQYSVNIQVTPYGSEHGEGSLSDTKTFNVSPIHTHSYSSSITTQPTCTSSGVETFKCSCGDTYTKTISATGHKYDNECDSTCNTCGAKRETQHTIAEWKYVNSLPSYVTSDKYIIEKKYHFETVAQSSPGNGYVKGNLAKTEYNITGYEESLWPLETSETFVFERYYYFHYCGGSTGTNCNYYAKGGYTHGDFISDWALVQSLQVAESGYDSDGSGVMWYRLKYPDGNWVWCKTGVSCDGTWGTHGERTYAWYRKYIYQKRQPVYFYTYTKDVDWTATSMTGYKSVQYRYRLKDIASENVGKACVICGYMEEANPELTLSLSSKKLDIGESVTLTATTKPAGETVTWTSSNPDVATVSNGKVVAKAEGTATITASFTYKGSTISQTCKITVECSHTKTTLHPAEASTCIKQGHNAYTICDTCGAIVSGSDSLLPLAPHKGGTATCTEKAICNVCKQPYGDYTEHNYSKDWKSDSLNHWKECTCGDKVQVASHAYDDEFDAICNICGYERIITANLELTLSLSSKKLDIGESVTLAATTKPAGETVTWTSSNPNVATVSSGKVTAKAKGTATITASFTYKGSTISQICEITVECFHSKTTFHPAEASTCIKQGHNEYTTCDTCGAIVSGSDSLLPLASHKGGTATCTEKAICSICKQSYGDYAEHNYSEDWKYDPFNHWKECSCGDKIQNTSHVYDNDQDKTCNVCGFVRSLPNPQTFGKLLINFDKDALKKNEEVTISLSFANDERVKTASIKAKIPDSLEIVSSKWRLSGSNGERPLLSVFYKDTNSGAAAFSEEVIAGGEVFQIKLRATKNTTIEGLTFDISVKNLEGNSEILSFIESVYPKVIDSIEISTLPNTLTFYESRDALDVNGGKLKITYKDKTTEIIDITKDMVSGFDNTKIGKQMLTVNYMGHICTYEIEIISGVIVGDLDGDDQISSDDAIYLLMATLFPSDYQINQSVDYDKNGVVNSDDAIYLLMYTLFPEDYPI